MTTPMIPSNPEALSNEDLAWMHKYDVCVQTSRWAFRELERRVGWHEAIRLYRAAP